VPAAPLRSPAPPQPPLQGFFPLLPTYSHNVNGLSLYAAPNDKLALARRTRVLDGLSHQMASHLVLLAQECKFFAKETSGNHVLSHAFPKHSLFLSAHPGNLGRIVENRAGVLIVAHASLSIDFSLSQIPLGPVCGGHAVAVRATARDPTTRSDFLLINLYLPEKDVHHKRRVLRDLAARLPAGLPSLLGGDLNLTFEPGDSSSGHPSVGEVQEEWDLLADRLCLTEVPLDSFTFFRKGISSKLDRFFVSLPESVFATHTPHSVATPDLKATRPFGDHLPVSLSFVPLAKGTRRAFPRVPGGIAASADFHSFFHALWQKVVPGLSGSPFDRWSMFKKCVQETSNYLISRSQLGGSLALSVTAATKVLSILTSPDPDLQRVASIVERLSSSPFPLPSLVFSPLGVPIQGPFHDFLNGHFARSGVPCPPPEDDGPSGQRLPAPPPLPPGGPPEAPASGAPSHPPSSFLFTPSLLPPIRSHPAWLPPGSQAPSPFHSLSPALAQEGPRWPPLHRPGGDGLHHCRGVGEGLVSG
jgi:hypothetical protein